MRALSEGGDPAPEPIVWRESRALGLPYAGRLKRGVRLPSEDAAFFTWDPIRNTTPNRWWRRYGTDRLVRTLLEVLGEFQDAHPDAPRVGIGDLSRPGGGDFGPRFGPPGHASHQNGLDADVYYPRLDRRERAPARPAQIDRLLAQDLVDRFVDRRGAVRVRGPADRPARTAARGAGDPAPRQPPPRAPPALDRTSPGIHSSTSSNSIARPPDAPRPSSARRPAALGRAAGIEDLKVALALVQRQVRVAEHDRVRVRESGAASAPAAPPRARRRAPSASCAPSSSSSPSSGRRARRSQPSMLPAIARTGGPIASISASASSVMTSPACTSRSLPAISSSQRTGQPLADRAPCGCRR